MTPPRTEGFHHVTMVSGDVARTLDFYRRLLGFSLVKRTVNFDDPGAHHLYFGNATGEPGTILTFFEWPRSGTGQWGVGGVHHVALEVDGPEEQLMWKRRLEDAGVRVSGPLDRGYFRSIYFSDPDGQVLEIATRGPGYAVDEPPDALGRTLVHPPSSRLPEGRDEEAISALTHPEPVPEVTPEMRLRGIHHVTGITDDLVRAGEFFESALGLRLVKKTLNQDDGKTEHFFWASYDGERVGPRSSLTLFGWPSSGRRGRPGTGQTHHVAFRAPSTETLEAWRSHLLDLGLAVSPVMDRQYFRSIYLRAPDGLPVEIATDGPGFAVDEKPVSLGRELQLPPWLESRRESIRDTLSPLEDEA